MTRMRPPKFIDDEKMREWMLSNDILGILLSKGTHSELIKRTPGLIKFVNKGGLPREVIEQLWQA